jgi:hypothetical protein
VKIVQNFNSKTKSSLKFGINTVLKIVQNENFKDPLLVFVFSDESIKILIDMLIIKCKARENTKIYLIDKTFKNNFIINLKS